MNIEQELLTLRTSIKSTQGRVSHYRMQRKRTLGEPRQVLSQKIEKKEDAVLLLQIKRDILKMIQKRDEVLAKNGWDKETNPIASYVEIKEVL